MVGVGGAFSIGGRLVQERLDEAAHYSGRLLRPVMIIIIIITVLNKIII